MKKHTIITVRLNEEDAIAIERLKHTLSIHTSSKLVKHLLHTYKPEPVIEKDKIRSKEEEAVDAILNPKVEEVQETGSPMDIRIFLGM